MSEGLTLRSATAADAAAVLTMVRAQTREEGDAAFSPARARECFESCLERGAVIVSVMRDIPVGTCALAPELQPLSDRELLRVFWCYVRPEHRRAPHMRELLRAMRAIGASAGLAVRLDCTGGEQTQGKLGLFRRELGDSAGTTFLVRN